MGKYADFYRRSIDDKAGFWAEQAQLIDWQTPFEQVLDESKLPFARWFVGGKTNLCYNAVDRHLSTICPPRPARKAAIPSANCMPR